MVTTVHIDTHLSFSEVKSLVATITNGALQHGSIQTSWGKVGVGNDLRSEETATGHPDDFLNWPYYLDTYQGKGVAEEDFLSGIYQLRNGLVEHGVRVWIVSDLDHTFPPGWTPDG
jgi:hypothetical protein